MLWGRRIVFPVNWVDLFIKIVATYAKIPKKKWSTNFFHFGDHFLLFILVLDCVNNSPLRVLLLTTLGDLGYLQFFHVSDER